MTGFLATNLNAEADPGFQERGFICIKGWGFALLILSISHENEINLVSLRPNYFIFKGYLKTGGQGGCSSEPPEPPLDPPLHCILSRLGSARECVATAIEQIRKFYEEMEHITLGEDADIIAAVLATCKWVGISNGVARMLKNVTHVQGRLLYQAILSTIMSLFEMGTRICSQGEHILSCFQGEQNLSFKSSSLRFWKSL